MKPYKVSRDEFSLNNFDNMDEALSYALSLKLPTNSTIYVDYGNNADTAETIATIEWQKIQTDNDEFTTMKTISFNPNRVEKTGSDWSFIRMRTH